MTSRRRPRTNPQIHTSEENTSEEGAGMARRCSPRLHPQIHASAEGAGMARRRNPQTQASEEGVGIAPRRSPRLHPQIHADEEGAGVTRRGNSPAAAASLPDDDDMLREILVRLSPQPSSLPRASAVCKRWRGLVTDHQFIRHFFAYHRKPPILGVFKDSLEGIVFTPMLDLDPPDRIPPARFSLGRYSNSKHYDLLDCRHGLVLIKDCVVGGIIVCHPITGKQRRVEVPLEFRCENFTGAVHCAEGHRDHVHGGCHSSPFKGVLVSMFRKDKHPLACVYSSDTGGEWGNLILTEAPYNIKHCGASVTLVGNVLYWLFNGDHILGFDLDRRNLAVTVGPHVTNDFHHHHRQIIQAEDGAVGFAMLAHARFQMWHRNANCQGVFTWVPLKIIEMHNILGLSLQIEEQMIWQGYDEDNDVIFIHVRRNVYSVQLKSMGYL